MKNLRLLRVLFTGQKGLYLLPLLVEFVPVPLLCWYFYQSLDLLSSQYMAAKTLQALAPVCVIWWGYIVLQEEAEGLGREVLTVYDPLSLNLLCRTLMTWVWYVCHMGLLVLGCSFAWEGIGWELPRLAVQSFFLLGMFYLSCILFGSVGVGSMLTFIYYFMSAFFAQENLFALITIFSMDSLGQEVLSALPGIFGVGVLFFLGGTVAQIVKRR